MDELSKLNSSIEAALKQYESLIRNEEGVEEPDISKLQQPTHIRFNQPMSGSNRSTPTGQTINNMSPAVSSTELSNTFAGFDTFGSTTASSGNDSFGFSNTAATKTDPFASADPFAIQSQFDTNAFGKDEPFAKEDPFSKEDPFKSDPFSNSDPFKSSSTGNYAFGGEDPFKSSSKSAIIVPNPALTLPTDALSRPKVYGLLCYHC